MLLSWFILYLLLSLFFKWIISWGGAKKIEGWKSFFLIGWFSLDWNSEQIRLYSLISWFIFTILFLIGCFNPKIRSEYLSF
ncbi:hypothetical protein EN873_44890 [bacterium M00.F.Ca.ET.230.01.1.1]|nr:hypothetical protein EN873_44890 [bacterium M00.F.Ca.ET.230.01.1.1]